MASETLSATFDETSVADANAAIDSYIDAIWTAVGGTPTDIRIVLSMNVNTTDVALNEYTYNLRLTASNETSALLKTALDALTTEYEDVVTDSSLYDTIVTVDGNVRLTINY